MNSNLYAIKLQDIWDYIRTQDLLFWLVNLYLFLEYVRPQTLYPSLDILPYSQIVIILSFFLIIFKGKAVTKSIANLFLFIFSCVLFLSSLFALDPSTSFDNISLYISWLLVYFIIINTISTEKRLFIFTLAFLLYSFKMSQHSFLGWVKIGFGYSHWGTGGGPGWFHNSGEFGIQMCVFLGISFYFFMALKKYWNKWKTIFFLLFPLTALTGTISSTSRGAMLGAAVVILYFLLKSRKKILSIILTGIVAFIAYSYMPATTLERFHTAGEDRTSEKRLDRWERGLELGNSFPLLGVGYKNWSVANRVIYGRKEGEFVHNIFIECFSELGYSGLIVFFALIITTFYLNRQTRKFLLLADNHSTFLYFMAQGLDAALIGYLVSGFFVTVFYYPYFWINLAFTVSLNNIVRNTCTEQFRQILKPSTNKYGSHKINEVIN